MIDDGAIAKVKNSEVKANHIRNKVVNTKKTIFFNSRNQRFYQSFKITPRKAQN